MKIANKLKVKRYLRNRNEYVILVYLGSSTYNFSRKIKYKYKKV